jgi:hypothetical protein
MEDFDQMILLNGYVQGLLASLVMIVVSIVYFRASAVGTPVASRILAASHGAVGAFLSLAGMAVGYSAHDRAGYGGPYSLAFILPAILVLVSFLVFRGRAWTHLLQLVNIPAMGWGWFIGSMAVTGLRL